MIAAGPNQGIFFCLSPGNAHDAPLGAELLAHWSPLEEITALCADRAYGAEYIRQLLQQKNVEAVIPPKSNLKQPWEYDQELYKKRNCIERLFHRLKNFRRIATRYDKLDLIYASFVTIGLILLLLREIC